MAKMGNTGTLLVRDLPARLRAWADRIEAEYHCACQEPHPLYSRLRGCICATCGKPCDPPGLAELEDKVEREVARLREIHV